MSYSHQLQLATLLILLTACGQGKNYRDTSALEKPPQLALIKDPSTTLTETVKKGLGNMVSMVDATHLQLKQPFDKAWRSLESALNFSEIEISDRNQEKGIFYVSYDPDNVSKKDSDMFDDVSHYLFKDKYPEEPYFIILNKKAAGLIEIEIKASDEKRPDLLNDKPYQDFDTAKDGPNRLTQSLYNTLRNDLPLE